MSRIINYRFLLLAFFALLFLGLITIIFLSITKKPKQVETYPSDLSSEDIRRITPIDSQDKRKPLRILAETKSEANFGIQKAFVVHFSEKPSPFYFSYSITPNATISATIDENNMVLMPIPRWESETEYKLTVNKDTRDVYGNLLDRNYEFRFTTIRDEIHEIY